MLAIMTKNIFWHATNIQVGMVMLKPQIITQDEHLDQRWVCVKLQLDGFAHSPKPFKQGNALVHFFAKSIDGILGMAYCLNACCGGRAIRIYKQDFRTEAGVEHRWQVTDLVDETAVTARTDDHYGAACVLFLEPGYVPVTARFMPRQKGDKACPVSDFCESTVTQAPPDIAKTADQ